MFNQKYKVNKIARNVAKNTSVLLMGTVVNKICLLILFMAITRYLGAEGFGRYSFAISFTSVFAILGDLGLKTLAIREVAKDKKRASKYLGNISILKTILSLIALGLFFLIIPFLKYTQETTNLLYIIGISIFFTSLSTSLRWIFQAFQKMEWEALINALQGVLLLGLGSFFLVSKGKLISIGYAYFLTSILILFFSCLITYRKFTKPKFEIDLIFWKKIFKSALPIGITTIFTTLYLNTDTIMLFFFKGDKATGLYNAGYKIVSMLKLGASFFMMALFPVFSNFRKISKEILIKTIQKSIYYAAFAFFPLSVLIFTLSAKIIPIIYGPELISAIPVLQILIWISIPTFFSGILGYVLIANDKQKVNALICFIGLIINLLLNFLLIPSFSYIGAAIAIVVAEFFVLFLVFMTVYQNLKINAFSLKILKILFASLLIGILSYLFKNLNIILVFLLSIITYLVTLYVIKGITKKDILFMKSILQTTLWKHQQKKHSL